MPFEHTDNGIRSDELSTTESRYEFADGSTLTREVVGKAVDNDTSTALSLDVTGLGGYDDYIVYLDVSGGSGPSDLISVQVNDVTTGYNQHEINGGSISSRSGADAWKIGYFNPYNYSLAFWVGGKSDADSSPTMTMLSNTETNQPAPINCYLSGSHSITDLHFSTSQAIGGQVSIIGGARP